MSYKSRFRPSEVLVGGTWRVLEEQPTEPAPAERERETAE
jgi:arginyl-tRNA--protein-N-Asp/Glu arginylyltransferase